VSSGAMNMALSGVALLIFMTMHLFQFRFGATKPYKLRPPPYGINLDKQLLHLHLFYTADESIPFVEVRDIYRLEYEIFASPMYCVFYVSAVAVFVAHYVWGWEKVVPSSQLGIAKAHQATVKLMGKAIGIFVGLCYISFPLYAHFVAPSPGVYGNGY